MHEIWDQNEDGSSKPVTDSEIAEFEEQLNIKLPSTYLELLRIQNGGYITYNAFKNDTLENGIMIDHIYGIGGELSILDSTYLIKEWELPEKLVLFAGDGHTWFAMDYRKTDENPPIIYIEVDEEIIDIASGFKTFLQGLYVEDEDWDDNEDFDEDELWTIDEIKKFFASNDDHYIAHAFDHAREHMKLEPNKYDAWVEKQFITLLHHPCLEVKEITANYAHAFKEEGYLSECTIYQIIDILWEDEEIAYYAEMFFGEYIGK
ncbi:SMI1/KNR4 family protein [Peribacillus butanolivorans]|uniref:SMI1/KNR4 family protein n=1 Tax=Peribacillus butanolivorans TaxID=421767 RepID=UPI0036D88CE1